MYFDKFYELIRILLSVNFKLKFLSLKKESRTPGSRLCQILNLLGRIIMFYLIGIGLYDEKDITVKGLEIVKRADRVYLEYYTSIIWRSKEELVNMHRISSRVYSGTFTNLYGHIQSAEIS